MKTKKLLVITLILIFILPSISLNALSLQDENEEPSRNGLIDKLLDFRFKIGSIDGIGRWYVMQLRPPTPIQAYPAVVNLEYLNETTIVIGGIAPDTGTWQTLVKIAGGWDWGWMSQSVSYEFEFVPPEGYEDAWIATFDPKIMSFSPNKENMDWPGALTPFKTNLTLTLNPSADPKYPTQDLNLKINIWREDVSNTLVFLTPPTYPKTYREEYLERTADQPQRFFDVEEGDYLMYNLMLRWTLLIKNLPLPDYDRRVENVVDILVKVTKDHYAEIIAPPPMEIQPYQLMSIPVTVKNLGSHIDTFNFRVNTDAEGMIVTPPPVITLDPGEEGQAFVGVAAPKRFLSVGTTHTIEIEAYSIDDPETVFKNTIILSTTGIHVSGGSIYYGALLLTIFVIFIIVLLIFFRKRREKTCKKPDKPWEIPAEKKYLEKLKEKDKKEYDEILKMMEDEYKSALLWYEHCYKAIFKKRFLEKKKARRLKAESSKIIKKSEKDIQEKQQKEKPVEKLEAKEQAVEEIQKPEEVVKEPERERVDREAEMEKRKRGKTLLRIKREQEKQRRKFK